MIFGSSRPLFGTTYIVESNLLTKTEAWRTERPWAHRKRHNPGQAFKYHSRQVPDMETVLKTDAYLVMHPALANRVREELAKLEKAPGRGYVPEALAAQLAHVPVPVPRPKADDFGAFFGSSPFFGLTSAQAFINTGILTR